LINKSIENILKEFELRDNSYLKMTEKERSSFYKDISKNYKVRSSVELFSEGS